MFIKKDTRKVPEIIADESDERETMLLGRRGAEFINGLSVLCHEKNVPRLQSLRVLSLYGNQLENIQGIEALRDSPLVELNLGCNCLTDLSAGLSALTTLERLWVDDNRLTTLPTPILQLTSLKVLRLSNNSLEHVLDEFDKLPELEILALDNNR